MARHTKWGGQTRLLFLALLGMIFMRLVWMEIRTYQPVIDLKGFVAIEHVNDYFPSCTHAESLKSHLMRMTHREPDYHRLSIQSESGAHGLLAWIYGAWGCTGGAISEGKILRLNQAALVICVFLGALLGRLVTSSWLMAAVVAAVLLSRGRLLAEIALFSDLWPMMVLVMTWGVCTAHFLRSASMITLVGSYLAILVGALLNSQLLVLGLVVPVMVVIGYALRPILVRPVLMQIRQEQGVRRSLQKKGAGLLSIPEWLESPVWHRLRNMMGLGVNYDLAPEIPFHQRYQRGGLLRPLVVPFILWIFHQQRWLLVLGVCGLLLMAVSWVTLLNGALGDYVLRPLPEIMAAARHLNVGQEWGPWLQQWRGPLDLDLYVVLGLAVWGLWPMADRGLRHYWEFNICLVAGFLFTSLCSWGYHLLHRLFASTVTLGGRAAGDWDSLILTSIDRSSMVVLWFEPLLLAGGVLSIWHILQVVGHKLRNSGA